MLQAFRVRVHRKPTPANALTQVLPSLKVYIFLFCAIYLYVSQNSGQYSDARPARYGQRERLRDWLVV